MHLITWNTQWCCGLDGQVSPLRIVHTARSMADFDVLCLQEVAQGYSQLRGQPGDQLAELQALLPGFQVFFGAAVHSFDDQGRAQRFGNLIATRLPVLQVQHHALPWPADGQQRSMPRMCTAVTVVHARLGPLRLMSTHLEYYSAHQRMAQVMALRQLHEEACAMAADPPLRVDDGSPFQPLPHTRQAVLCGDFNCSPLSAEYAAMVHSGGPAPWVDAWTQLHGAAPHPPTFQLFDRSCSPVPVACDFVFVSADLADKVQWIEVDLKTQASDHQPVLLSL